MAANKHRFLFIGLLLGLSLFAVACDKETSDPPAFSTDPTAITTTEPAATEPVPTEPTVISNGIRGIHIYTMNKPEIAESIVKNVDSIIKAVNK